MTARTFVEAFRASVQSRRQNGPYTPTAVVGQWEQFVDMVEAGYDDNVYEYDNDLSVRQLIAELLEDPSVRDQSESAWFIAAVAAADRRLRTVMTDRPIRDIGDPWWRSHLPTVAGTDLAADLQSLYDYRVSRVV